MNHLRPMLVAGAACWATGAWAAGGPQSSAVGLDTKFVSGGVATELGPVASLTGRPSGRYDSSETVSQFKQGAPLTPSYPTPTVTINASNIGAHVTASGIGVDSRSSEADTSFGKGTILLTSNPPPWSEMPIRLELSINAQEALASVYFSQVYPKPTSAAASVRIGQLTVSGPLVGGRTLHWSGQAPPNTVLYDSPTVTITLNRRLESGVISCSQTCTFTPTRINTTAIDVDLHNADVGGTKVSGEIDVGEATAQ